MALGLLLALTSTSAAYRQGDLVSMTYRISLNGTAEEVGGWARDPLWLLAIWQSVGNCIA